LIPVKLEKGYFSKRNKGLESSCENFIEGFIQ